MVIGLRSLGKGRTGLGLEGSPPLFVADEDLMQVQGIFVQDGILHVLHQALVNFNQILQFNKAKRERTFALSTKTESQRTVKYIVKAQHGGRAHRNVDKHFEDFSSGEEFLQGIQEVLAKETVWEVLKNVLIAVDETTEAMTKIGDKIIWHHGFYTTL